MEIIPAIDIIDGKAVRLSQGDYARKKEYGKPLDIALEFQDHGIERLHLVDLDGAREKRMVNYRILEEIATRTSLVVDAGGGLRSAEDVRIALDSGAAMVTGGSIAVKDRKEFLSWIGIFGHQRIILGADYREGLIAVSGWEEATELRLMDFLEEYRREGVSMTICTDITLDGMLEGPSLDIYAEIKEQIEGLYLVASGGISGMKDLYELEEIHVDAAILGKAIYEGRISLKELEAFILKKD